VFAEASNRAAPRYDTFEGVPIGSLAISSLTDVVASIPAGGTVYLGNFGAPLHCVAHEMIRQRLTGLHVIMGSGGIVLDALIGAGSVDRITFAHCWGPIGPTPAWNFRRSRETPHPVVQMDEMSLGAMYSALLGGAWGVAFMPIRGLDQTGYIGEGWTSSHGVAAAPWGQETVVRSLAPDLSFVHADRIDRRGNAKVAGPSADAALAAQAARRTVIVAEEIVDRLSDADIAGAHVSQAVVIRGAVRPDGTPRRYGRDLVAYERYAEDSQTQETFAAWIAQVRR